MLKTKAAALMLTTSLLAGGAVAQTTTAQTTTPVAANASTATGQFVTDQSPGQFRASKFVGLDVYGSEGQKIGDINEVLIDKSGNAQAVVIGVGGFLGIGEKNVAVPFSSLDWVNTRPASTAATTTMAPATGTGMATPPASTIAGTPTRTDTTASTTQVPERSPAEQAAYNGYPDHATVRMSKGDLQNAPQFKYYADTHSRSGGATNATTTPMTTPRQ